MKGESPEDGMTYEEAVKKAGIADRPEVVAEIERQKAAAKKRNPLG